ncbi:uncharacterized protein C1orf127 homolog isoform X2 [Anabas testudineus]|nr:uncharacterized protein C1orf127 homolog isoform X2 [Anabas testudineus]
MEMWIHRARIEGLILWLSGALEIQIHLDALDHINLQLSACGYSLHKDPDMNFIFRVSYTGCLVQQQHSFHVLKLNLVKRINRFGHRPHSFIMTCPVVSVVPNREQIQCDPEYIQVIRQVPYDNWNNELHWSLSLSDHLIVALEDASLIQMNVDMNGPDITVQGRRTEVLSPVNVMENEGEFLALKLVSGQYAYSMEATCPKVTTDTAEQTVLHIFKRHMGLTKRGSYDNEGLTLSNVLVNQTDDFTVHDTSGFVILVIPTDQILQTKTCTESKQLMQPFYRVDVVLTFRETNHKMHWTMENMLPCTALSATSHITPSPGSNTTALSTFNLKAAREDHTTVPKLNDRAPAEELTAEFSTTSSPHAQTEGSSFHFHTEVVSDQGGNVSAGFNSAPVSSISEFHKTTPSTNTSAQPNSLESSGVTKPSTSFHTTYQQFNTTRENKDQQGQKGLKWIW